MDPEQMRRLAAAARVGRLAGVREDGRPHVVPICFAFDGASFFSAVDDKPKRTRNLLRLENIRSRPGVELVIDHYEEDWSRAWWVRVAGDARVFDSGPERDRALAALAEKYEQYRRSSPPGPAIVITPRRWSGWSGAGWPATAGD
ncbi:MAG: TIGR03668 family PPOX class F420-dependent oxidoreductase [Candidatus Dormibacteraceae bacterium]